MRTPGFLMLLTAAIIIVASVPAAFAQQASPGGRYDDMMGPDNQTGRGNAMSEEKREEIRKKIETVRIWRLTERLKLDTATSAKLASFLNSFDQQRKSVMREQMAGMRELRSYLQSQKPDEAKIKTALGKLQKNQHALQELRDKEFDGLKEILTVEQQAQFLLFQQEFQREMREMIAGARGGGSGPWRGRMGNGPTAEKPVSPQENK